MTMKNGGSRPENASRLKRPDHSIIPRNAEEQALHRRWLHALEDDFSVPYYAMQVARVIADFYAAAEKAAEKAGVVYDGLVNVRWSMLLHCTHQRRDRLSQSLAYLTDSGWLTLEPSHRNGQRKYYRLTNPAPVIRLAASNGSRS